MLLLSLAAASPGSSIPIVYGDCIEDSILIAGEEDTLTFDGAASEVIIARMARISGDLAVHLEIFEPFGALIAESWGFAYATVDTLTLPSSGIYVIVASTTPTPGYTLQTVCTYAVSRRVEMPPADG